MHCAQRPLLSRSMLLIGVALSVSTAADSLPPLVEGKAPGTLTELWGAYDPAKDPLETQVVREWAEGTATFRTVVFTIGTFKGKAARMAAFYAFPTDGKKLPAILQVHGGGQKASLDAVRNAAANGYAGLSINWGGNRMERYQEGDAETDWGAIDATQKHNDHYGSMKPDDRTLDAVESPRNNNWFMLVLAARRGLTFLEQQPEVDGSRLGVTGHSMGGKITVDVAGIDRRVKAAVPSCGGAGMVSGKLSGMPGAANKAEDNPIARATIDDTAYIPRITCPILYMSPTNDFAGPFDNMTVNWPSLGSSTVAYTIAPHLNHRSLPETSICGNLWFETHLKHAFDFPRTPQLTVDLAGKAGVPCATVVADRPDEVSTVDIYYAIDPSCLFRFWRDARAVRHGDAWTADLPVMRTEQPLFVYANVHYRLSTQVIGERGSKAPSSFIISSKESIYLPEELKAAKVVPTDRPERMIDDFSRGWHDWYRLEWGNPHVWVAYTRKLKDPKWHGPVGAKLVFDVICPKDNVLVIQADVNEWGVYPGKPSGSYNVRKPLTGSPEWQTVTVSLEDLRPDKGDAKSMTGWDTITQLSFRRAKSVLVDGKEVPFGDDRQGWPAERQFRNLRWEGGIDGAGSAVIAPITEGRPADLDAAINQEIKTSLDRERRERGK